MLDDLESNFDVIIVGTDLTNCILSAALARVGVRVLHVDNSQLYGGNTKTFNGREFVKYLHEQQQQHQNIEASVHIEGDIEVLERERGFEVDLLPKMLLASGPMVRLLIDSGVCRYLEFKLIPHFLINICDKSEENGLKFFRIPFTKEDVFVDKSIPLIRKRKLMKALTCVLEKNDVGDDSIEPVSRGSKGFKEYLTDTGLDQDSLDILAYGCMHYLNRHDFETELLDSGRMRMKTYINSAGKYGASPYLIPLYGSSELSQAFCRVSAVYGGTLVMGHQDSSIDLEKRTVYLSHTVDEHVKDEQESCGEYSSNVFVVDSDFERFVDEGLKKHFIHRAVLVLSSPLSIDCKQKEILQQDLKGPKNTFVFVLPPVEGARDETIYGMQVSSDTNRTPYSHLIVHLLFETMSSSKSAKDLLQGAVNGLLNGQEAIATAYFTVPIRKSMESANKGHDGLYVSSSSSSHLEMESCVQESRDLFDKIIVRIIEKFKGEGKSEWDEDELRKFLPQLPDPELEHELMQKLSMS